MRINSFWIGLVFEKIHNMYDCEEGLENLMAYTCDEDWGYV